MDNVSSTSGFARTLSLRGAVALNMLDMIGVGPFITLPLILSAMGGPQAMLGWILGALLALCDGLVWAELGAAMPHAGGSYEFLRRIYPGRLGRFLGFLFLFQLLFSAPLSVASGSIGLSQYAGYLFPSLNHSLAAHVFSLGAYHVEVIVGPATAIAIATILLAVFLLYRNISGVQRLSLVMGVVVLGTIAWILWAGFTHAHWSQAFAFPPGAFRLDRGFLMGLASAMLIATYDYWGYYNITFLGGEVKDPARTIPRAILLSIAIVAVLYLWMNLSVLAVLPWRSLMGSQSIEARRAMIAVFMQTAYGGARGQLLGKVAALLVMFTAFTSVFSLLLGYSRIPFAAARDKNFLPVFGRIHPTRGFPHVSLLTLAGGAVLFCFFSLQDVIAALVVLRILLQFLLQHIGIFYLRRTQPELPRPFRVWLYPLPPLLALGGFLYILFSRANSEREILLALGIALLGAVLYLLREARSRNPPSNSSSVPPPGTSNP